MCGRSTFTALFYTTGIEWHLLELRTTRRVIPAQAGIQGFRSWRYMDPETLDLRLRGDVGLK